ncbi:hypothetical protein [Enterobacter cloacae]|uniref:hypothetical protein n=1 Tax=Enterobacter cloacae TaxID=550 RepID=UPI003F464F97
MIKKLLEAGIKTKGMDVSAPGGTYFDFEGYTFLYLSDNNTIHKVIGTGSTYREEPTISTDSYTIYGDDEIAFAPVVQRLFNIIIS